MLFEQGAPLIDDGTLGARHVVTVPRKYDQRKIFSCNQCTCMYCRRMDLSDTHPASHPAATQLRWSPALWAALIVLCGVVFLDALDVSMVGMALPSIQRDLKLSTDQLQWIVSGYVLGYGGLLLLGGRAADLLGRRRVLLWALGVFVIASALGGLTTNGDLLIAARFIKGASAAFTAPAALVDHHDDLRRRSGPQPRAQHLHHSRRERLLARPRPRWVAHRAWLALDVPAASSDRGSPRRSWVASTSRATTHTRGAGGYDVPGAVTASAAMLLLVRTVVTAPASGWGSVSTLGGFVVSALLLGAFIAIELRSAHPLVRLGILRSSRLVRANIAAMALFGSYIGFQFIGTLYLQSLLGWSSLQTAFAFLPAGVIVAFGSTRIAPVIDRFGTPRLLPIAFAVLTAGYALFIRLGASASYVTLMLPTVVLLGIGFAIGFPSLNVQATNGVADDEQGLASGLLNTSFQLGGAIGLAIVTAVVTSHTGAGTEPEGGARRVPPRHRRRHRDRRLRRAGVVVRSVERVARSGRLGRGHRRLRAG